MANWNVQRQTATILNVSGNAASTLTTGTYSTFFPQTNVPGEGMLAASYVVAAAETADVNVHLGAVTSDVIPTRAIVRVITAPTFTSGSTPTVTAKLVIGDASTSANDVACSAAAAIVSSGTTALTAGSVVQVPLAAVASGGSLARTAKVLKVQLALTGSPTNYSGKFEIFVLGMPYVFNV